MDPAQAFLQYGSINGAVSGIGFTLGHGSWTVNEATRATPRRPILRNSNLIDEPARWPGIPTWAARKLTRIPPIDWWNGFAEAAKVVSVPIDPGWKMVGGTQAASVDNGLIVLDGNSRWELQGLRWDGGAWRVDAMAHITPGMTVKGSQGPWSKLDGLLRPDWLRKPWPGPVRLVGFNVSQKRFVPGAWIEHPGNVDPYPGLPPDDRRIPCGQVFKLEITDAQIEQWIASEGVKPELALAVSMRWFARGLREHGMRLSESGTGQPILESSGGANPVDKAEFAKYGIATDADAGRIGRNIFKAGTLVAA